MYWRSQLPLCRTLRCICSFSIGLFNYFCQRTAVIHACRLICSLHRLGISRISPGKLTPSCLHASRWRRNNSLFFVIAERQVFHVLCALRICVENQSERRCHNRLPSLRYNRLRLDAFFGRDISSIGVGGQTWAGLPYTQPVWRRALTLSFTACARARLSWRTVTIYRPSLAGALRANLL